VCVSTNQNVRHLIDQSRVGRLYSPAIYRDIKISKGIARLSKLDVVVTFTLYNRPVQYRGQGVSVRL